MSTGTRAHARRSAQLLFPWMSHFFGTMGLVWLIPAPSISQPPCSSTYSFLGLIQINGADCLHVDKPKVTFFFFYLISSFFAVSVFPVPISLLENFFLPLLF